MSSNDRTITHARRHQWRLFDAADVAWASMLADCRRAQESIDFEQYIFEDGKVARLFMECFMEKARKGISVRMMIDVSGSFLFYHSSLPDKLKAAGVQVRFFNPISPWRLHTGTNLYFRDHRKILVVDGRTLYTGSLGVGDSFRDWRESTVRVVGSAVAQAQYVFDRTWDSVGRGSFPRFKNLYVPSFDFNFVTNSPRVRRRFFYKLFLDRLRRAQHSIYLVTPYFVPDLRFFRTLTKAARRGVDVRILLPRKTDHPVVDMSGHSYFTLALRAGVKIYFYEERMLHAKYAIIDGEWGSVGSFNLDSLSFLFAYEANVVAENKKFATELTARFFTDIKNATLISYAGWIGRGPADKILELLTWPFHKLL